MLALQFGETHVCAAGHCIESGNTESGNSVNPPPFMPLCILCPECFKMDVEKDERRNEKVGRRNECFENFVRNEKVVDVEWSDESWFCCGQLNNHELWIMFEHPLHAVDWVNIRIRTVHLRKG